MSADLLREAAALIRAEWVGYPAERFPESARIHHAVADWLDVVIKRHDEIADTFQPGSPAADRAARHIIPGWDQAAEVARAYLGRQS